MPKICSERKCECYLSFLCGMFTGEKVCDMKARFNSGNLYRGNGANTKFSERNGFYYEIGRRIGYQNYPQLKRMTW